MRLRLTGGPREQRVDVAIGVLAEERVESLVRQVTNALGGDSNCQREEAKEQFRVARCVRDVFEQRQFCFMVQRRVEHRAGLAELGCRRSCR